MENTEPNQTSTEPNTTLGEPSGQPAPDAGDDKFGKKFWLILADILLVLILLVGIFLIFHKSSAKPNSAAQTAHSITSDSQTQELKLNTSKNYGDKYANGLLPVGDGKYSTSEAKQGYIYTCSTYAQSLTSGQGGGAGIRGPWFTDNNTEYNVNKKARVEGNVKWTSQFSDTLNGSNRVITTNDLPNHLTGVFPIMSRDPAYSYDRNPNSIKSQSLSFNLAANPVYGAPHCMGGQAGIMLTGVALFNGFDAEGRDAGAWEVQDGCDGHPEKTGEYHYHTLSSCIKDTSVSTVIGFALDGFPITGPKLSDKNILTTADLDECHGIVSTINLDGKNVTTYHYVMTQDFPYSVSCFRAEPISLNGGQGGAGQGGGQPGSSSGNPGLGDQAGGPPPPRAF